MIACVASLHLRLYNTLQASPALFGVYGRVMLGRVVMIEMKTAPEKVAIWTVLAPLYLLLESPELAACKRDHPATGTLVMSLEIEQRRFVARAAGELAEQPIGLCARQALERIAAETVIPREVTTQEAFTFPVPLP